MTTVPEQNLLHWLLNSNATYIGFTLSLLYAVWTVLLKSSNAFLGPLSKYPGPRFRAMSILPLVVSEWRGTVHTEILALHNKYGPVVRIAPDELSFLGEPQVWKDIYGVRKGVLELDKASFFYTRPPNGIAGIISATGPAHARQRKAISPAFSERALKEQEPLLKRWAGLLKDKLKEKSEAGVTVNMVEMFNFTTFDVMADLTFAEPLHLLDQTRYNEWVTRIFANVKTATRVRVIRRYGGILSSLLKTLLQSYEPMLKARWEHKRYIQERVDRRLRNEPERPDISSRILENVKDDEAVGLQEYSENVAIFMIAGTETSATCLSNTLFQLASNPEYMNLVKEELHAAFTGTEDIHLESLAKLPVLNAVIQESLRIYPPVPIGLPRQTPSTGIKIGSGFVPGGTVVSIPHFATQRSVSNFAKPDQYRPERWLGHPDFEGDQRDCMEPFSYGPRNCAGQNLAWHEMRLILSTVLLHFDFKLTKESLNWSDQRNFALWEKGPLTMELRSTAP